MITAAKLVVQCLEAHGVEFVFGIPGAKIDAVFDALVDSSIKLILCRHEQNAAFMAQAYGRLTGKPGVVLVTSGPGVSNLTTGLLTATTEGDPVVAIGGNVARSMQSKQSHQSTNNVKLLEAASKFSIEMTVPENLSEAIANAFRLATAPRSGACFISVPQDVLLAQTDVPVINPLPPIRYGAAHFEEIEAVANKINRAQFPILLLGEESSRSENAKAVRLLLEKTKMPTVSTFQAAGVVSRELEECFAGRIGLFHNQPGDQLIDKADLIITVGFNTVEYDPEIWNASGNKEIVHIDYIPANIHVAYQPRIELLGDIDINLIKLTEMLIGDNAATNLKNVKPYHQRLKHLIDEKSVSKHNLIHPLEFIHILNEVIDDETLIICDVGTVYIWMARYFLSYNPRHLLFSNGQQTLGVALPWAIAASLTKKFRKIISIAGDGGFLFSAMEMETAVRETCRFVQCIWTDGTYNMVLEQEVMKYNRKSGVNFGKVDMVHFAKAFGAEGFVIKNADDLRFSLKQALNADKPVILDIPIDYSDNKKLFATVDPDVGA